MKYKIFVATYSYLIETLSVSELEYQVIKAIPADPLDVPFSWSSTHETLEEAQERIRTNLAEDGLAEYRIVRTPKTISKVYTATCEWSTERAAWAWLNSQKDSRGHDTFDCRVEEVVIDADDLGEYEFKPTFTVEAYVNVIKRFEIEVDTAETDFEDCEDEYAVEQLIRDKINSGDYEDDIDYADVWDTEVNDVEVTED
jgi:hypothetical protein